MCGRYALALRPSVVRQRLEESHMPSQEAPDDEDLRETYNFAPGYYGLVYRADLPDHGSGGSTANQSTQEEAQPSQQDEGAGTEHSVEQPAEDKEPLYKIQAMKWGLIPFWTKRQPDYGSAMRTINCRDDSLATSGGMWNTMKRRKRCIVIAQGFYEWLKKDGGKVKVPHYVKRKDGQLMCFAGLWDCVQYEGSTDKLYTYTIITTDPNKQLTFLHDRMPVILNNGSEEMFTWLDSKRSEWSKELQSLLKPFEGELECYPVTREVGKVGNNSPTFIVPVDSSENKQNIANFFGNQKRLAPSAQTRAEASKEQTEVEETGGTVEHDPNESRATADEQDGENNAPKPVDPEDDKNNASKTTPGSKRGFAETESNEDDSKPADKMQKTSTPSPSPKKKPATSANKRSRNATSNNTAAKQSPVKASDGSQKITSFFNK